MSNEVELVGEVEGDSNEDRIVKGRIILVPDPDGITLVLEGFGFIKIGLADAAEIAYVIQQHIEMLQNNEGGTLH